MGIFDQMKQAMQMRSEAKRIQQEIEKRFRNEFIRSAVSSGIRFQMINDIRLLT